jgi:hypothetical protein
VSGIEALPHVEVESRAQWRAWLPLRRALLQGAWDGQGAADRKRLLYGLETAKTAATRTRRMEAIVKDLRGAGA